MKAEGIYKALDYKYKDNKYVLKNSYVFDWESDFFFKSSSGYHVEIEVKVSKSDFKADFLKPKHKAFLRKVRGEEKYVVKGSDNYKVIYENYRSVIDQNGSRIFIDDGKPLLEPDGIILEHTCQGDLEKIKKSFDKRFIHKIDHIGTEIYIRSVGTLPNKFMFACPEGLIQKEEVPDYAGLLWITEFGSVREIKRAPFIHKETLNLDKVLLDKFYWLSKNLGDKVQRLENTIQRLRSNEV